jgi:hypothetical protein
MSQLTIEIDTPEDEALLLQILPKFNSRVVGQMNTPGDIITQTDFVDVLKRLTESGVADKFRDPLDWQREVREDKPLFGRSE